MVTKLVIGGAVLICAACNIVMVNRKSAAEMRRYLIDGQCFVGRVFANLFYLPSWILKVVRAVILATVK